MAAPPFPTLTVPNTFVPITTADANQVNADFAAVVNAINNLQSYANSYTNVANVVALGVDPTGSHDNYSTLQNLLNNIGTSGAGAAYFPPNPNGGQGIYLTSQALNVPSNCALFGDNPGTAKLLLANNGNGGSSNTILQNSGRSVQNKNIVNSNISIRNLGFDGNATGNTSGADSCIAMYGVYGLEISGTQIYDCDHNGIVVSIDQSGTAWNPALWAPTYLNNNQVDIFSVKQGTAQGFPIRCLGTGGIIATANRCGFKNLFSTNDAMDFPGCSEIYIGYNQVTNCGNGFGTNGTQNVIIIGNLAYMVGAFGIAAFASGGPGPGSNGVNRLIICANQVILPGTLGIRAAGGATPTYPVTINDNHVVYAHVSGSGAISCEVDGGICHDNQIDLQNVAVVGINLNCNNWEVKGNKYYNVGSAVCGINMQDGQTNHFITQNDLRSFAVPLAFNKVAPVQADYASLTGVIDRENPGHNPVAPAVIPTVSIPTGSTPVQNTGPFDLTLYFSGGTVTGIYTGISATFGSLTNTHQTSGAIDYPIGSYVAWAGSGAPTIVAIAKQ